jgi:hypothetical protein
VLAGKEALEQSEAIEAERARLLRVAWDEGMESLRRHGPQLESDEEFEAFMDELTKHNSRPKAAVCFGAGEGI